MNRFTLERYLAGELSDAERATVETAATSDPRVAVQLQTLREQMVTDAAPPPAAPRKESPFDF